MAKIIFAEQTLSFSNVGDGLYASDDIEVQNPLIVGETYKIDWDGVVYECVCTVIEDSVGVGNAGIVGMADTGEPFFALYDETTDGYKIIAFATTNTVESHTVAIYQDTDEETSSSETEKAGISIVLYDRTGAPVTHEAVDTITTDTPEEGIQAIFTYGEVMEGVKVELALADGNQTLSVPKGYLVRKAVIKKPETLLPENIRKDVNIGGVTGTLIGTGVEKTVDLNMANGDQIVEADEETLMSKVVITKPETLVPENIVEGVNIGGVVGEFKSPPRPKAINFYDQFGDLYASYTRAEAKLLEVLPDGPEIEGLEFDAWTHTLDDVKNTEFFLDVGPAYKKNGVPTSILVLNIPPENLTINLCLYMWSTSYKVEIDWGDGTTTNVTGTSNGLRNNSHTYANHGIKYVCITPTVSGTNYAFGRYNGSSSYPCVSNSASTVAPTTSYWTPAQQLISILANESDTSGRYNFEYLRSCYNLKFISYRHIESKYATPGFSYYTCKECISLKHIACNHNFNIGAMDSVFESCGIERLSLGTAGGGATAFKNCPNLTDLIFRGTSIEHKDINQSHRLILTSATPPKISNTSPLYSSKNVYVPDDAVETYKTSDGWKNIANYIKPASEFPDF